MAEIQVECGFCGHTFAADEADIGNSVSCKACGRPTLAVSEEGRLDTSKLQLKQESGAGKTSKDCPACGGAADEDALICIHCGYNWQSGQVHSQRLIMRTGQVKKLIPYLVVAIIAAAGAYYFANRQPSVAMRQPAATGDRTTPSEPEQPAGQNNTTPTSDEEAMILNDDTNGVPAMKDTSEGGEEEASGITDDKLAAFEERYRERLRSQLDQSQPMFEKNTEVAVRKNSGMVLRGSYLGVKQDVLVLAQENDILEIPLKELDRPTRVRCDDRFREFVVEQRVQTRMQQLRER